MLIFLSFLYHCTVLFIDLCLTFSLSLSFSLYSSVSSILLPLSIELQVQEQPPAVRAEIYSHMEAFVPCNKEALLKRLKKLSLNIQVREA